jgi:hypothetical protein
MGLADMVSTPAAVSNNKSEDRTNTLQLHRTALLGQQQQEQRELVSQKLKPLLQAKPHNLAALMPPSQAMGLADFVSTPAAAAAARNGKESADSED